MSSCFNLPDAEWQAADLLDEIEYNVLSGRLDKLGKLVSVDFSKGFTSTYNERVYHFGRSTVKLSKNVNTSLNQYGVNVKVGVYSSSEKVAKKVLEEIVR